MDSVLQRVDAQTAIQLERTVRDALALAERRQQSQPALDALGYPIGYFAATSGSFAAKPLESPPDLTTSLAPASSR